MAGPNAVDAIHSRKQMLWHLETEVTDEIEEILGSLLPDGSGPYTWVMPMSPDGGPAYLAPEDISLRVEDTRQGIRDGYTGLHTIYSVVQVDRIIELNGSFYSFIDTVSHIRMKDTGDILSVPGLGLFPTEAGLAGIRGEIMWGRNALEYYDDDSSDPLPRRKMTNYAAHDALVAAFRSADLAGIEKLIAENALLSIRDQVNDEIGVTNHKGRDAAVGYFESLFARFTVDDVHVVQRVVEDWYVFSELCWYVSDKSGAKSSFLTAEFATTTADGRFRASMGHGTARKSLT